MGAALPSIFAGRSMLRPYGKFPSAVWTYIHVIAKLDLAGGDFRFGVKSEALAVHDEAHVCADLPIGPEIERLVHDQVADAIVALDQVRDFGGGFRGGDIFLGLGGRREESHARHVLREHGDERKAERLVDIGDEFVARHVLDRAVTREFLLEGQVPVLVALAPPEILQAAPELVRLLDAADLLPARGFRFRRELVDEPAQGFLQAVGDIFVVEAGR